MFRFGPVAAVALFAAVTLDRYGDNSSVGVVGIVAVHAATTTGAAAWSATVGRRRLGRPLQWPLFLLHVLITIVLFAIAAAALSLEDALRGLVPKPEDIAAEMWGGALAAVGAVYLLGVVSDRKEKAESVMARSRAAIPQHLRRAAERSARRNEIDPLILMAILIYENAQRPPWFRRLERIKGLVIRSGTYGIAQVYAPEPIDDEKSIEFAAEKLRGLRMPSMDDDGPLLEQTFRDIGLRYNGDSSYGKVIEQLYSGLLG